MSYRFCVMFLFIWNTIPLFAQKVNTSLSADKPLINAEVYHKWKSVYKPAINPTGRYVSYAIKNEPISSWTLVIKSVQGNWKVTVPGGDNVLFTKDGRFVVYKKPDDSLVIVKLGASVIAAFSKVRSFSLKGELDKEIVVMKRQEGSYDIVNLFRLRTGKLSSFPDVKEYIVSDDANNLVVLKDSVTGKDTVQALYWINTQSGKQFNVWTGSCDYPYLIMDNTGKQIAFLVNDYSDGKNSKACLYYKFGNNSPVFLFNDRTEHIDSGAHINRLAGFNKEGSLIFMDAARSFKQHEPLSNYERLNIWSYLDTKLQTLQEKETVQQFRLSYSFSINNNKVNAIAKEGDVSLDNFQNEKVTLLWHQNPNTDFGERLWNKAAAMNYFIVSTANGRRRSLSRIRKDYQGQVSPDAKYVVFFDGKDYHSYEMASGTYRNITNGINSDWLNRESSDKDSTTRGVGGWLKNDAGVYVYDKHDIWLLDPSGKRAPRNITNGYGRKHDIAFNLGLSEYQQFPVPEKGELILNATGLITKYNGFFKKNLADYNDPSVLSYGPYVYNIMAHVYVSEYGQIPLKAHDAGVYMVSRMSATESLNYFVTTDFKKFIPVSQVHPEQSYNWYTTELYTWKTPGGVELQGILYKPENFDSTKKYPLILNYYERLSANLNVCLIPDYSSANMDIPTYVSNGYLVFTPDIKYTYGDPLQSAYNAVVSATQLLSGLPFIDAQRIGVQGFSFGSVQTNYILTHSDLFAAACSASGLYDFVSAFGAVSVNGYSLQNNFIDNGQNRMNGFLWEVPDDYIKNSAVFRADKVNTPLLMMHTPGDAVCPFSQALEFFTALRRLNKKVWLLEYKDWRHSLHGKAAIDFDHRMRQFFDYYLKGYPAPSWMIQGTPASDVTQYLSGVNDKKLLTKENILSAIEDGKMKSSERIFQLICEYPEETDKLMQPGYAAATIYGIVRWEEIYQKLWIPGKQFVPYNPNPNWSAIRTTISDKYNTIFADSLIIAAQLLFYFEAANWPEYIRYADAVIKKYPPKQNGANFWGAVGAPSGPSKDSWALNWMAWGIFKKATDPIVLKKAIAWSELSIKLEDTTSPSLHQYLDTKANLLYKLGKVREAIVCEKKAIASMRNYDAAFADHYNKSYQDIIRKMEKGQPTWSATTIPQ